MPDQMSSGCAKSGHPLNTSALTSVILNIKLQNLHNLLLDFQSFPYDN
jgi:hypothetical protein